VGRLTSSKAPIIVFNDADLTSTVNGVAFASFVASGQTCVSGTRIIIQDEIYDRFIARFLEKVENITERMGNRTYINPSKLHLTVGLRISAESSVNNGLCHFLASFGTYRRYVA
jgi:hypothetical protein